MAWQRLGKTIAYPTISGGHFANEFGGAMEEFGAYTPDTVDPLLAPVQLAITVPNVASPKVWWLVSMDLFTNVAGTEHGWFGLYVAGVLMSGSRKRVTSGGPNNKRRMTYDHTATDLTAGAATTAVLRWEAVNADDVRANQADDGLTRVVLEAYDVS